MVKTALLHAIHNHHEDCTEILIAFGANVNIPNDYGISALMYASHHGVSLYCVDMLIQAGAEVNIVSNIGKTAMLYSASKTDSSLKKLIEAGADVNSDKHGIIRTPLMQASNLGNLKAVAELIKAGADLNIPNKYGFPLVVAARKLFFDCVTTLFKAGADIDTAFLADIAKKLTKGI